MDELLAEFLTETGERLDQIDVELVRFEREPNDAAILNTIFGLVHTVKGACVLGSAETTSGLSPDFMPVPENCHGIFNFTSAAVAERAERIARRRREAGAKNRPPSGDGGAGVSGPEGQRGEDARNEGTAGENADVHAVQLDRVTADLLEARARARGLSLAELLAELPPASFLCWMTCRASRRLASREREFLAPK
jgi:hypothetical protein